MPNSIKYSNALILINKLLLEIYKNNPNIDDVALGLEEAEPFYTVTELASEILNNSSSWSANKINRQLETLGLQTSEDGEWFPTDEGMKYVVAYSERHHIDETNEIRELRFRWKKSIIPILRNAFKNNI